MKKMEKILIITAILFLMINIGYAQASSVDKKENIIFFDDDAEKIIKEIGMKELIDQESQHHYGDVLKHKIQYQVEYFFNILDAKNKKKFQNVTVLVPGFRSLETNGLHVKRNGKKYIILLTEEVDTLYHELGHSLRDIYEKEKDPKLKRYENEILKYKEKPEVIPLNPNGEFWNESISESFAEDFRIYLKYSLVDQDLERLEKTKGTNYEFNRKMISEFDELFPEIKRHRERKIIRAKKEKKEDVEEIINSILSFDIKKWAKKSLS